MSTRKKSDLGNQLKADVISQMDVPVNRKKDYLLIEFKNLVDRTANSLDKATSSHHGDVSVRVRLIGKLICSVIQMPANQRSMLSADGNAVTYPLDGQTAGPDSQTAEYARLNRQESVAALESGLAIAAEIADRGMTPDRYKDLVSQSESPEVVRRAIATAARSESKLQFGDEVVKLGGKPSFPKLLPGERTSIEFEVRGGKQDKTGKVKFECMVSQANSKFLFPARSSFRVSVARNSALHQILAIAALFSLPIRATVSSLINVASGNTVFVVEQIDNVDSLRVQGASRVSNIATLDLDTQGTLEF